MIAGTADAREAARETTTGRFGIQPHSDPGEVDPRPSHALQPGQKRFAIAMHQSAAIESILTHLRPDQRSGFDAAVGVLAALSTPGDPGSRTDAVERIIDATHGPSWGVGSKLRQTVGAFSQGRGDVDSPAMTEATAWLVQESMRRADDDTYLKSVSEHMWRLTHPACRPSKRRRHAEAVTWALTNAATPELAVQLIKLRCDGFEA